MQNDPAEHNQAPPAEPTQLGTGFSTTGFSTTALCGLATALAVVFLMQGPRFTCGPTAADLSALGVADFGGLRTEAVLWSFGAAAAVVLLLALVPFCRARIGVFGIAAAGGLAAALASLCGSLSIAASAPVPFAAGSAALALLAAPLVRDRGIPSMVVTALALGALIAAGRAIALADRAEAQWLDAVRDAVLQRTEQRQFVAVSADTGSVRRRALALRLWFGGPAERVDLLCVDHDSADVPELLAAGWRGWRIGPARLQELAPEPEPSTRPADRAALPVRAEMSAAGPVLHPQRPAEPTARYLLTVITPCGAVHLFVPASDGALSLDGRELNAYRRMTTALAAGMPVLCRIAEERGLAASDWQLLRLPQ